jgi:hypothetical protein
MSKHLNPNDFDAVIGCYNIRKPVGHRQKIWNRAIARAATSHPIFAKCGLAGLKAAPVNP